MGAGGGIDNFNILTITNSTFTGNDAISGYGGGICNGGSIFYTLTVINSTFANNSATYDGGGICNYGQTSSLTNCTISGNTSQDKGGGIYDSGQDDGGIYDSGPLTLTNCTISGNTSQDEGGGIYIDTELMPNGNPESITLNNTIVAGNTSTSDNDVYGYLNPTSAYNIIGDGSGVSPIASSNLIGTTADPINPMLGPLANNGGPTQTMALLPGSPAINFWSCRFLTPPDQIAARYSLGCDCRSCLASTFRPVGVSIFSASSFSSRCSAS